MIKTWTIYIILLLSPVFIFSQQQLAGKKDSLTPGMSTSISFALENNSDEDKTYDISVTTSSASIIPILAKGEFHMGSHQSTSYIVPFRIASEASKGAYSLILKGIDKNSGIAFTKTAQVTILGNRKLSLTPLEYPDFIRAGETIRATFLLKNNGNVTEKLILESKNAIVDEEPAISLAPNDTKIVSIHKETNPELGQNEYQNLNLSVYSTDNPKENQNIYISTQIISVKPQDTDIYHRLPIAASLSFVGMKNMGEYHDGFQGELYGKGSLDKDNKNQIEFRAVTHNPVELNNFTQYEEYFVNYRRDHLFVHLGDKTYSSSYLTEYARYGRGAEIRYDFNRISIGGFYNHP